MPLEAGYGRGWFVDTFESHTIVSHTGSLGHFTAHILLVLTTDLGIAVLTNASAIIAAGHTGQYDLGIGLAAMLLEEHRDPVGRGFLLTYVAPTLAWTACVGVLVRLVHVLNCRRGRTHRASKARTARRLAAGAGLLLVGVALLAAPLDTARHFYPDTGWALSVLAPLAVGTGLIEVLMMTAHALRPATRRVTDPQPARGKPSTEA